MKATREQLAITDPRCNQRVMVISAGQQACALPLEVVVEVTPPLATEAIPEMPFPLRGLAVIRGVPTPVFDLGTILGLTEAVPIGRFVVVRPGGRRLALAVEQVRGLRELESSLLWSLSRIVDATDASAISAVGIVDQNLLCVLQVGRMIPESLWRELESKSGAT